MTTQSLPSSLPSSPFDSTLPFSSRMTTSSTVASTATVGVNETTVDPNLVFNVSRAAFTALAVYTGFLTVFGILNNGTVLVLFYRYESLRIPINSFLLNVTICDMIVSCLASPFTFASNLAGRWLYGDLGCTIYAFLVMVAGCEQIVVLAVLSVHRCLLVVRPFLAQQLNHRSAALFIALSWIYSLIICLPPWFGWSSFGYEGPGTSCAINWNSRRPSDSTYIIFIFIAILAIPLTIIIASYSLLIFAVKKIASSQAAQSTDTKADRKVTKMVVLMVGFFMVNWSPYAIFSLYVSFGENPQFGPVAATLPSFFAKLCTVYNPIIYFYMNKQFKDALIDMLCCGRNPFEREESDGGDDSRRGPRTGGNSTRPAARSRRDRVSSLPTATSALDIPLECAEDKTKQGVAAVEGRVPETSTKVRQIQVAGKNEDGEGTSSSIEQPLKLPRNNVDSLPPAEC
ncbi:pinopsin-like [Diadema setosum]|uniref:pinopsin-like n=1 Tax=Diadema setosum TaxID=31175 RepID=UPI003B3B8B3F